MYLKTNNLLDRTLNNCCIGFFLYRLYNTPLNNTFETVIKLHVPIILVFLTGFERLICRKLYTAETISQTILVFNMILYISLSIRTILKLMISYSNIFGKIEKVITYIFTFIPGYFFCLLRVTKHSEFEFEDKDIEKIFIYSDISIITSSCVLYNVFLPREWPYIWDFIHIITGIISLVNTMQNTSHDRDKFYIPAIKKINW